MKKADTIRLSDKAEARAAFSRDFNKGLLFTFVPFYDLVFALGEYDSQNKAIVITAWFGGPLLAIIGALLFFGDIYRELMSLICL